ncbi:MAG: hypothetical protein ACTSQG_06920 [Promethearchaeota archaeon]
MNLDPSYWKDRLLIDFEEITKKAEILTLDTIKRIFHNKRRAVSLFLDIDTDFNSLINALYTDKRKLKEILLLDNFTKNRLQDVVGIIIEAHLSEKERRSVLKREQHGVRDYSKYDKFAGIVKLYQTNPDYLHQICLLQVVHTRSHIPFHVKNLEKSKIVNRINSYEDIQNSLDLFDQNQNDGRRSKYIGGFESLNEFYLFFIREFKRTHIMTIDNSNFNTECEWIVIRIPSTVNQIRVSYQSNVPIRKFVPIVLGIGDVNTLDKEDIIKIDEKFNSPEDVEHFLRESLQSRSFPLIEIKLNPAPIRGGPILCLANESNRGLRNPLRWFKDNSKDLLEDIFLVKECKIYFKGHRIRIVFNHTREGIQVGYSDYNLNNIEDRIEFEEFMAKKFNIMVMSGVKF